MEVKVGRRDLKCVSRVNEAVGYDPLATCQCRTDNASHMIKSSSAYQQELLCRGEPAVRAREHRPHLRTQLASVWFLCRDHRSTDVSEFFDEQLDLLTLPTSVNSFDTYKWHAHSPI
nr:hypothetical protein [Burkholderia gladioli]